MGKISSCLERSIILLWFYWKLQQTKDLAILCLKFKLPTIFFLFIEPVYNPIAHVYHIYICKTYFLECLLICNRQRLLDIFYQMSNRSILDVFKMNMI